VAEGLNIAAWIAEKFTEKEEQVNDLHRYITQLEEHSQMLGELVSYIEKEDILDEKLYELVDKANNLIAGPTRAYVDQD
jgi:hypothetical protein|tara:strand:+ start:493 stop:729 length:237 start_codon:yes stop_codon:yes gene_type:complete